MNINISLLINMKMSFAGGIFIYICRNKNRSAELSSKKNNTQSQHCRTDIELTILTFSTLGF